MSDVTKFCAVIVAPVVLAALAAEELRKSAERRKQREADEARRRQARIERRSQDLRAETATAIAQLDTFVQGTAGQYVEAELTSIRGNLSQLTERILGEEGEIADVAKQLKGLRKRLAGAVARAEASQLAAQVGQQQATLQQFKRQAAADRLLARRFDPDGLRQVDAQVSVVESCLQQKNPARVEVEMARLQELSTRHLAQVEQQQDRWNQLQEEAVSAVAAVQEQLASLQADEVVKRWRAPELEELSRRVSRLEKDASDGRFTQVRQDCESLTTEAKKLVAAAEEAQRLQDHRDFVERNLLESMAELGFWTEQFPAEQPSADAMIRATLADGCAITVNVPLEGPLRWTTKGFPMELLTDSDGNPVRACDKAAKLIEAVKSNLQERGVGTGELLWKGKNPNRPGTTGVPLPRSVTHSAPQTHRART